MASQLSGRPGRPLRFDPEELPDSTEEVRRLVAALIELMRKAGTGPTRIAGELSAVFTGKQDVSRRIKSPQGPDKHVVQAVVKHCAALLREPERPLLDQFEEL